MKLRSIFGATVISASLTACTFFEEPINDIGNDIGNDIENDIGSAAPGVPAPSGRIPLPAPPPLPSPSQTSQNEARTTSAEPSNSDTYLIVSSIFEVPETASNLSFVHFTNRSSRRESALCEALLNLHPITSAADVPANADTLIIWPIVDGANASDCRAMVRAHEPLDISSETAAVVNSNGPYLMSRNSSLEKQMIYDLSAVSNGSLPKSLNRWLQIMGNGASAWQPVVKAR